jgi:hypothetical protein
MSVSKRKAYLMAIALGGVALVVDKCVLTESVTAPESAEAMPNPRTINAKPPPTAAVPGSADIPELPFPRNLPVFDGQRTMRDLFLRSSVAVEDGSADAEADNHGSRGPRNANLRRDQFQQNHRLNGVLIQDRLRIAIVDGQWVHLGDSVSGCELIEVTGNEAHFRCVDGDGVLTVITPGSSAPR